MSIIVRTLVILAAALVVVAGMFAFRQSSLAQNLSRGPGDQFTQEGGQFNREPFNTSQLPSREAGGRGFERGGHAGREGGGIFGMVEVVKNAGIMAVLIAIGALLTRTTGRKRA